MNTADDRPPETALWRMLEWLPVTPAAVCTAADVRGHAGLRPPITRLVLSAAGMFIFGLVTSHGSQAAGGDCPGLERYMSQPYATDKGQQRRCELLREIESRGRVPSPPLRELLLEELSNRFAIELDFKGDVALPGRVVDYLLGNMPETAALVSAYSDKEYRATQTDATPGPESFFVTNSRSFAARFTFLSSRRLPGISEHIFFEGGHADVLFWRVWGNSFVRYTLRKNGGESARYDVKIHVFTDSRLLRTVLRSRLFGYFANRMFKGILSDIESAVHRFNDDSSPGEHLPAYFVAGLKTRLEPGSNPLRAR